MKLKKLLSKVPLKLFKGNKEIEINGICSHSKKVAPGDLFISRGDERHIEEAVQAGAVAILSEMENPFLKNIVQLMHPKISAIEGALAANFYENPSAELFTVGVTGTSGKTTTSYLIKHLLDQANNLCGLIGTIEQLIGTQRYPSELTTPDVVTSHRLLREMCKQGCVASVMEVSSHGLMQGRVDQIDFDVAIFTNLTQDHLDYHQTMEEYANAKAILFRSLTNKQKAIISTESPWSSYMIKDCQAEILTYGFSPSADLFAHEVAFDSNGAHFKVTYKEETLDFSWKQIGRYNILNCLAACGAVLTKGISFKNLPEIVSSFPGVPGRLERVGASSVFVDYAHKPDALEKVLECLQEFKKGKIITIFGCGGDRDRGKRPLMAAIAEKFSDSIIVTSDNPRTEDPLSICLEIVKGFSKRCYIVEPDRKKAIELGIKKAQKDDLILIAGKGHETYQIFAHQTIAFDDKKVAAEALMQR